MRKYSSKEKKLLIITSLSHSLSHYNMLVFPAIALPLAHFLDTDVAQVLKLSFWMYFLFGVSALPWGMAADRWGAAPLLLLFHAGAALSSIAAAIFISSPFKLAFSLAFLGSFSGIYHPAGTGIVSKEIKEVSSALAVNGIFGSIGICLAPVVTGLSVWLWGLKAGYLLTAFLNLSVVIMIFFSPLSSSGKKFPDKVKTDQQAATIASFCRAVMTLPFTLLLIAMTIGGVIYTGSTVVFPAYLEIKNTGLFLWIDSLLPELFSQNLVATAAASFILCVGILGQYAGGWSAKHYEIRSCYLFFYSMTIPFAFFISVGSGLVLVMAGMFYFFFLLGIQPIENTLVAGMTPDRYRHSAYGTKFIFTFGIGAFAVEMVSYFKRAFGIESVFYFLGSCSVLLALVIIVIILKTEPFKN